VFAPKVEAVKRRLNAQRTGRAAFDLLARPLYHMHACATEAVDVVFLQVCAMFVVEGGRVAVTVFLNDIELQKRPLANFVWFKGSFALSRPDLPGSMRDAEGRWVNRST
jgi:hypothetical protein